MPKPTPPLWVIVLPDTVEPSAFVRPSAVPIAEYWNVLLVTETFFAPTKNMTPPVRVPISGSL